jgi:hypothetical protein
MEQDMGEGTTNSKIKTMDLETRRIYLSDRRD